MKILVPTDFSKLSKVAVVYAANVAKKLKAEIVLLAVINIQSTSKTLMKWKKLEEEMIRISQEDADQLIAEIKTEVDKKLPISYHFITGVSFGETVEKFVSKNDVDLIVMGTKGASGVKKVLLGSNAAAVIDNSSVPVIVIPGNCNYTPLKKIVYATDLENLSNEIKIAARIASLYNAKLDVLHVNTSLTRDNQSKTFVKELVEKAGYSKLSFKEVSDTNVAKAINDYLQDSEADMLAMFTHKLDFYEKLFGRGITRQLAFHSSVPLMTFNKSLLQ
jgi:nucleotide-binding universal stress UspA family protein